MAVGEIIGAAVGILMLIIVAYLVVGSTLSTAEIVTNTQKDVTLLNEARMRTGMSFFTLNATSTEVNFCLNNTGSEIIRDFPHMDVFTTNTSGVFYYSYSTGGGSGSWKIFQFDRDFINPRMLDPGEAVWINVTYVGVKPTNILVSTSNGVYTSSAIT